ncbi:MAG: glycogen/starch/alpha-glucan phosphorylase [Proteobacteria bacterium]|nr:MAG: glycogen/starch/alpha-glucan phosphorylase [Pseudomonadota bacterium]
MAGQGAGKPFESRLDLHSRTGLGADALKRAILDNLYYSLARFPEAASLSDWYCAVALTVRDRLLFRWLTTARTCKYARARTVCLFSAEYLLGPHLGNNVINLGIEQSLREATAELGLDLGMLCAQEEEPGLGNGGLGRLAACCMDSLATGRLPAIGYGIRYEFGIFEQQFADGWQIEKTDKWLRGGNPWEVRRPKIAFDVKLGGYTEHFTDDSGNRRTLWVADHEVRGIAYDTPIPGYRVNNVNLLRLWSAEAVESFDFQAFNTGDYYRAVGQKVVSENLTKVLYPNDEPEAGKQLRLQQQYFFVSCSLQDMIRIYLQSGDGLDRFHERFVIQLNDTHPSIAVAELMRLFVDEHHLDWDAAWRTTRASCAYTNHTLLPEALEKWPVELFERVLPRHLEIILEINAWFLDTVRREHPGDEKLAGRVSLIEEGGVRYVRMSHLAAVGSYAINGVSALHSRLMRESVLANFHRLMPDKFSYKTNGVTPRRFMALANPGLAALISDALAGDEWVTDLERLRGLESFADDSAFRESWRDVKRRNKIRLAGLVREKTGIEIDPDSLFDVQVKRIHEYKRQHLNILHVLTLYNRLKLDPAIDVTPRTFIFGGKAAPGYRMAKLVVKLINTVAQVVNEDPDIDGRLKVVLVPNYNVKTGQVIFPAAELSEQISTAGMEASGTGNMKLSLNGALTIGTLDGANIEIRDAVGAGNFFLFGMSADEVRQARAGDYRPGDLYRDNHQLRTVLDLFRRGGALDGDVEPFRPLLDSLLSRDEYMVLADYQDYVDTQERVGGAYRDHDAWTRRAILNVARMGYFSSDRAVAEYNRDIWRLEPVSIDLGALDAGGPRLPAGGAAG